MEPKITNKLLHKKGCPWKTMKMTRKREKERRRELCWAPQLVSRRTLHSKVSTQQVFQSGGEHWRYISLLVPTTSPADRCTQVIYFSPPHLTGRLLPITKGRGSAGFLVWHPLFLDATHRGYNPRCASHLNFHCCGHPSSFKTVLKIHHWKLYFKHLIDLNLTSNQYKCLKVLNHSFHSYYYWDKWLYKV